MTPSSLLRFAAIKFLTVTPLVLVLWAAVHPFVVERLSLTPWKGFGLAMYTIPRSKTPGNFPGARLNGWDASGKPRIPKLRQEHLPLLGSLRNAVTNRFSESGVPTTLAKSLFIADQRLNRLELMVSSYNFNVENNSYELESRRIRLNRAQFFPE